MALIEQEKIDFILNNLKAIEYGSLVITIHDGRIVQVDKTEKNRLLPSNKSK